ncbi:MAG: hypothetical protein QXL38_03625 [Candidatus Bathyarchaeia archaeon]
MKTNIKKALKLATLLITSILIATASAQVYTYMFLQGTITIGTQKIVWIKDNLEVFGDSVSINLDNVELGKTMRFNDTAYLKNKDTVAHTIVSIEVAETVGSHFEICKAYIYENFTENGQWTLVGVLDLKDPSSKITSKTLDAGGYYRFDFEIRTSSNGTDNTFTIKVTYE